MHVDVLIIGQGICGTMLSWFLKKEGRTFMVIDEGTNASSSKAAAGIINPITGRRYVTTWMIDELLSFAKTTYSELSDYLEAPLIYNKSIIDFFPSAQMRNAFTERIEEDDTYLHTYPEQNFFNDYFNYDFGCGEIGPAYMVDLPALLGLWTEKLNNLRVLRKEKFVAAGLKTRHDGIAYDDITAEKIVLCDGVGTLQHPWFQLLPFAANKGEALLIECEGFPSGHIFKKGMTLAPLTEKNVYWVGSNYQWEFENEAPSTKFYQQTNELLKHWLKRPFTILEHKAAVRPATIERRPFVGFHPLYPAIGILNGMGTKGSSLAPFFAHQLVQHLVHRLPLADDVNIHRFNRILSK